MSISALHSTIHCLTSSESTLIPYPLPSVRVACIHFQTFTQLSAHSVLSTSFVDHNSCLTSIHVYLCSHLCSIFLPIFFSLVSGCPYRRPSPFRTLCSNCAGTASMQRFVTISITKPASSSSRQSCAVLCSQSVQPIRLMAYRFVCRAPCASSSPRQSCAAWL